MTATAGNMASGTEAIVAARRGSAGSRRLEERVRARRYPISRWYLRPAAGLLAAALTPTGVRPVHLTLCGLLFGAAAAAATVWGPTAWPAAAALVLVAWLFDRADGQLARRQQSASAWGAWLDANVDELLDVLLHVAVALAAASQTGSAAPWLLLVGFLSGKYLFMQGLTVEEHVARKQGPRHQGPGTPLPGTPATRNALIEQSGKTTARPTRPKRAVRWLRTAYHLPGNADVRVHLLAAALWTGWLLWELALVAVYYNLRWIARYRLVARRLGGRG
ncbi:MAG: CDP-alcohol phosphatidyltransferase family protein [Planctomycetota bacterium]